MDVGSAGDKPRFRERALFALWLRSSCDSPDESFEIIGCGFGVRVRKTRLLGWAVLLAEIGASVFAVPFVRFTAGDCVSASLSPRITR